jgi:tRNA (cmo5U34)-methyltransferase
MADFEQTFWADSTYAATYRDHADNFIVERQTHLAILRSFFREFVGTGRGAKVLDLGSGDGILTAHIQSLDPTVQPTLVDGFQEMLDAARERLENSTQAIFINQTFDELIRDSSGLGQFDLVMSSFAIHHLDLAGKTGMFRVIFDHLQPGGAFINIDTVLPDSSGLTDWYYTLYREWIEARERQTNPDRSFADTPDKDRYNPDNQLSNLSSQLAALRGLGFTEVDCHYRYGIFAIYSGRKPA